MRALRRRYGRAVKARQKSVEELAQETEFSRRQNSGPYVDVRYVGPNGGFR